MKKSRILPAGFTVLEVAAVIIVGGLILLAASSVLNNSLQSAHVAETQTRMQEIEAALGQYLSVNGVLPCPALLNDTPDNPAGTFGVTANKGQVVTNKTSYDADPKDCYNSAVTAHNAGGAIFTTSASPPIAAHIPNVIPPNKNRIVIGAVPVRSLNLPDQDMVDGWGDRFVYAVTDYLTVLGLYNPAEGAIGVVDTAGNPIVGFGSPVIPATYAQYIVLSYGEDHAGAYTLAGGGGSATCPATGYEHANCALPQNVFTKASARSSQTGNNYFDDYLLYHSQMNESRFVILPKGMILPFTNMTACPTGWTAYGTAPGTGTGTSPPPLNTAATPGTCNLPTGGVCCQKL